MNVTRSGRHSLGAAPAGWYASTTGSAGNAGTVGSPWDLATALAGGSSGQVKPGDTIWLRSGTYAGPVTSTLAGAVGNPIIVRSYPGEWAKIDGVAARDTNTFTVQGSDTWYWGFEVLNSNTDRVFGVPNTARGECFYVTGPRTKFINLIVHDGSEGFGLWDAAIDAECYGCLVYNNGSTDKDIIDRIHATTAVGHQRKAQTLPSGRAFYVWRVTKSADALWLVKLMLPYLGERRTKKALEMMAKWDAAPIPPALSEFCGRGHPFSGRNLRMAERQRACRLCERDRMRKRRAAAKSALAAA